jgi:preprotein translocase subunit SecD
VSFRFTQASARKLADFTAQNVGRVAEMRVDGKVYTRPVRSRAAAALFTAPATH